MANVTPRTFVDAMGRTLFLAKAPSRVISMAPSLTEILFALGAEDRVVAVTQSCDFPSEAKRKTQLKGTTPSIEQILALKPDLVLIPQGFIQPDLMQQLDRLKVPAFVLQASSLEDVLLQVQTVARMLERGQVGDALVRSIRQRMAVLRERLQSSSRPRVLYVLNSDPLQSVGPGSFIHQLIDLAGGVNIATEASSAYPRLSLEDVIARDPEYIVFPVGDEEGIPVDEQEQWRRWQHVSAVKQNRLVSVPSVLIDRPGPRLIEGLERLARTIHPEVFLNASPEAQP